MGLGQAEPPPQVRRLAGGDGGVGSRPCEHRPGASRLQGPAEIFPQLLLSGEVMTLVAQLCVRVGGLSEGPASETGHAPERPWSRAAAQQGRGRPAAPSRDCPGDSCVYFHPEPQRDLGAKGPPEPAVAQVPEQRWSRPVCGRTASPFPTPFGPFPRPSSGAAPRLPPTPTRTIAGGCMGGSPPGFAWSERHV